MSYLGDYPEDFDDLNFKFNTRQFSTGAPFALAGSPVVSVYKSNSDSQSTAGITLTNPFDSVVGMMHVKIDLSADAFYAAGEDYQVVLTAGTVDSVSVIGAVLKEFSIERVGGVLALIKAGSVIVASVTGAVGSVTGAVGSVTGAVGSVTGAVGSVAGNVDGSVGSVAGNVDGSVGSVAGNVDGSTASVTGAVGSVTGAVGSVAGNVDGSTASVTGAVGSVTGAVGSVTGAVGSVAGNVDGSTASVTGAVGSVTGAVGSVTGAVGSVTGNVGGNVAGSVGSVTGDTKQTGDNFARIGAPAGASVSADIAALEADTIQKNAAYSNFEFLMVLTSDHVTPATGLTVTGERSIDGGAFSAVSGTIAEISNGIYQFDALAADTNGDVITWRFSAATADDSFVTFNTSA